MLSDYTKSVWTSKAVWGGIVAVAAGGAGMLGYTVDAENQAAIVETASQAVELVSMVMAMIGGVTAIIGRIKATRKLH